MTESIRTFTRSAMLAMTVLLIFVSSARAQDNAGSDTLAVDVPPDAQPNLTGNWILNVKASDDMAAAKSDTMINPITP